MGGASRLPLVMACAVVIGAGAALPPAQQAIRLPAARGKQLWAARYNGPGNDVDYARAVAVSPDGSTVFVTGYSDGATSYLDYATLAYDAASGAPLWLSRYSREPLSYEIDRAEAIGVSPDGSSVYVTGGSTGSGGGLDYATLAYDAATGSPLWIERFDGPGKEDIARSIAVSHDGSMVFVTELASLSLAQARPRHQRLPSHPFPPSLLRRTGA